LVRRAVPRGSPIENERETTELSIAVMSMDVPVCGSTCLLGGQGGAILWPRKNKFKCFLSAIM
jgi:hypothetical protein